MFLFFISRKTNPKNKKTMYVNAFFSNFSSKSFVATAAAAAS
jgi:hypothetical protein